MAKLQNDVVELAHIEMMRRVLEPVSDDLPDPSIDFERCLSGILDRTEASVYSLPAVERPAYFLEKARAALAWCREVDAPAPLTDRVSAWLARLEAASACRSRS